ncbi:hypothetical protein BG011_002324 [Mortierella polycephala]|uniref:Mid2 domain-containing protein n=1 Tax=Mortierella polycephala TaxID=41804 RepID=A0A9P6U504_9FUNG|nr:hypothetical protein BG011_002324 [Mortierella polycephala]
MLMLFTLLVALLTSQFSDAIALSALPSTIVVDYVSYPNHIQHPLPTFAEFDKRQLEPLPPAGESTSPTAATTASATSPQPTQPATTTAETPPSSNATATTATSTTISTQTQSTATHSRTSTITSSTASTQTETASPTQSEPAKSNTTPLAIGGAAVGGLVFAIGIAIIAFRCTLNRKERQRRNKEMAATLAESFDRGGETPRKGYLELGDGPPTPNPGSRGANLSRDGSQDAYYAKEGNGGAGGGGAPDFYNPHYVQERYGGAHAGNYGMYEETELSVMGGNNGRPTSPYDHSVAYPPSSVPTSHYPGYGDGGYYGGGGQAPRAPQGY